MPTRAIARGAARWSRTGADILDVGGESTRPGAEPLPDGRGAAARAAGDRARSRRARDVPISIDTYKASVARAALDARRDDRQRHQRAAVRPGAGARWRRDAGAALVLMHNARATRARHVRARRPTATSSRRSRASWRERRRRGDRRRRARATRIILDPGLRLREARRAHAARRWRGWRELAALGCPDARRARRASRSSDAALGDARRRRRRATGRTAAAVTACGARPGRTSSASTTCARWSTCVRVARIRHSFAAANAEPRATRSDRYTC